MKWGQLNGFSSDVIHQKVLTCRLVRQRQLVSENAKSKANHIASLRSSQNLKKGMVLVQE